jgi:hypothetical protein
MDQTGLLMPIDSIHPLAYLILSMEININILKYNYNLGNTCPCFFLFIFRGLPRVK